MSAALQTAPALAQTALHPDIVRLMGRPGYYLSPDEPKDVQRAMTQLAQEDSSWKAHTTWRDAPEEA